MMFYAIYAVRVIEGEKHRHFIGHKDGLDAAKHLANCATCGNADYAYVKDQSGATVFHIAAPSRYHEMPIQQTRPIGQRQQGRP